MASKKPRLEDLPVHLRGLSNNRWGGHKSNKMRGFRGSTYGAASRGKYIPLRLNSWLNMKTSIQSISDSDKRCMGWRRTTAPMYVGYC